MLSAIVFAAAGMWILFFVLVLALCKDAKAGDEAMDVARARRRVGDARGVVVELVVNQRDRDVRQRPRVA
jgi:hypothetical protein